ncbi:hypothetical protein H671_2g4634 [Cricetulus griseus]|nr:hypothetical protein H671_2g4634 [Cricetulus griseus]
MSSPEVQLGAAEPVLGSISSNEKTRRLSQKPDKGARLPPCLTALYVSAGKHTHTSVCSAWRSDEGVGALVRMSVGGQAVLIHQNLQVFGSPSSGGPKRLNLECQITFGNLRVLIWGGCLEFLGPVTRQLLSKQFVMNVN